MVITVFDTGKKAGASLPDLLTRPVAKRVLSLMLKKIELASADELVICDFAGIEVIDPSFVDECLISLIIRSRRQDPKFFVMLRNLSKIAEDNITGVISLHNENSKEPVSILTEQLTSLNEYCIGALSRVEGEIVSFLRINGHASFELLSSVFPFAEESGIRRSLESMYQRGLVRKKDNEEAGYRSV